MHDQQELFADSDLPPLPSWFTNGKTTPAIHKANVAANKHPLGLPLLKHPAQTDPPVFTCGNCKHCRGEWRGDTNMFFKCAIAINTHGPATDIRKKWAACMEWECGLDVPDEPSDFPCDWFPELHYATKE